MRPGRLLRSMALLLPGGRALAAPASWHASPPRKLVGGVYEREHTFRVPVDWAAEKGETMDVFVRELTSAKVEAQRDAAPALMFCQGGPGFASPRPSLPASGWLAAALGEHRVLLLDQRGTGRSGAATPALLRRLGAGAAPYLAKMRADSIACDMECVRKALLGDGKLGLLGQSYGGFVMLAYLSRFADHADRCLFTCGLAPMTVGAEDVYRATAQRMVTRTLRFYQRYPDDVANVRRVARFLSTAPQPLPSGGTLTPRRFQMLGLMLGSASGMENLHWLLETAWEVPPGDASPSELSDVFLRAVDAQQAAFETNPVYWLMHESIYADGAGTSTKWAAQRGTATNWAAQRVLAADARFSLESQLEDDSQPVQFTGECVFSWMADDFVGLAPLAGLAEDLARREWTEPLYDLAALAGVAARVPVAALVSYDDVYVERTFSEAAAAVLGPAAKLWVTNEFQHSGLRDDGARVFETLLKMSKDEISLPS
ncbi:prolyl aminopeptidase [Pelagophyceae sp. CCMP2097]|nr:prolyl aminopeptidase [Pelagophyceae sp. CCMP2097]